MIKTYVIEEKDGLLIEHLPGALLNYQNGKKTARQLSKLLPATFHVVDVVMEETEKVAFWTKEGSVFTPTIVLTDWSYTDRHIRATCSVELLDDNQYQKFFRRMSALKVPSTVNEATEYITYYLKEVKKADGFSLVDGVIEYADSANVHIEQFGTFSETAQKIIQV
jgi:hypothetical protein